MKPGSTKYDAELKEWSGPPVADMKIDTTMPLGEFLLEKLQYHGDKLIQVRIV